MEKNKIGEGVNEEYKKNARKGGDVLWHVKIKGRKELADGINLHMSLKVFPDAKDIDLEEIKAKVKEFDIKRPDPAKLKFKTTIFKSEFNGSEYYMLLIEGADKAYEDFYNSLKHVGTVYKKFMPHITIDKALYDDINENGLKPEEVEFDCLTCEFGAGNTAHEFEECLDKSEALEKGILRTAALGAAIFAGAANAGAPNAAAKPTASRAPAMVQRAPKDSPYSTQKMLQTIAQVESSGGSQQEHKEIERGLNRGTAAFGKYGLTNSTIRDTIRMNKDLRNKYKKALSLDDKSLHNYMQDNKGLEDVIAERHVKRLEHHFGQNPDKIGYGWLNGVRGTYKAGKENKDLASHWHVKKIKDAYNKLGEPK